VVATESAANTWHLISPKQAFIQLILQLHAAAAINSALKVALYSGTCVKINHAGTMYIEYLVKQ